MQPYVDLDQFLALSDRQVADIVCASRTKVCVFPFNGTRRWFLLEHEQASEADSTRSYIEATTDGYIRLFRLLFDHGIETVIAPVFGSEILSRGEPYMSRIGASMGLLGEHPRFMSFYKDYDVRVRFYGDYRKEFSGTVYQSITELFDKAAASTSQHNRHNLYYGVFASDATQYIAELSVEHFKKHGTPPTREELITAYYGGHVEKANLFIGFEKFSVFDYPMLNWGEESLYFTIAPSLYMTETLLRKILHDCIYFRPLPEPDYSKLTRQEIESMRKVYQERRDQAFGVGRFVDGIWYADH